MNLRIFDKQDANIERMNFFAGKVGFGNIFTDHMFSMKYSFSAGWHDAKIHPNEDFSFSPASLCLHYAQSLFEGMKAFWAKDGSVCLFRVKDHFLRMKEGCKRLCIPDFDEDFVISVLKKLIKKDIRWVPKHDEMSLYIRPIIIATENVIGVRSSREFLFYIILSPVEGYHGCKEAIKVFVETEKVRAVVGGIGNVKAAANYAGSMSITKKALEAGCQQVLWLDAIEKKFLEEAGAMNIFFAVDDVVSTPRLSGSILPGITRDSVIKILRSWGLEVIERDISIFEVMDACKNKKLKVELFVTGTAAVVVSIGELLYKDDLVVIGSSKSCQCGLASALYNHLCGIQRKKIVDSHGWVTAI